MKIIAILGWKTGFQKLKFTELLRRNFDYSLSGAKAATDAVLDNQRLELHVQEAEWDRMLSTLSELGAKYAVEEQVQSS